MKKIINILSVVVLNVSVFSICYISSKISDTIENKKIKLLKKLKKK